MVALLKEVSVLAEPNYSNMKNQNEDVVVRLSSLVNIIDVKILIALSEKPLTLSKLARTINISKSSVHKRTKRLVSKEVLISVSEKNSTYLFINRKTLTAFVHSMIESFCK